MTTTLEAPFHLVPTANTSLSAFGISLVPGRLYRVEPSDIEAERDDFGQSWLEHLDDDAQRRRWGAVKLRVVEVETQRDRGKKVALTALGNVSFQGRGRLVAGEQLVMPASMAAELGWTAVIHPADLHHFRIVVEPGGGTAS